MRKFMLAAALATTLAAPMAAAPAFAQDRGYDHGQGRGNDQGNDRGWHGDRGDWNPQDSYQRGNYRERRLSRNDRIYRGRDGRAYCRRSDGTTGLVLGALGGGVLANLIGGGTLGTLAGAGGGALLGRSVDRGNVRCR